ncbi:MAG: M14 family zinc carboxypeptidase, partial [Blastocatellia bacterium]
MCSRLVRVHLIFISTLAVAVSSVQLRAAAAGIPTPQQFLGFRVGEDKKLARWEKIVEYMRIVAGGSNRVRLRELGKSTNNNPFILLEISSADTIKNLDRFKQLERKLYFQGGAPSTSERDEIFRSGKAVVLVSCNIHSTEIGSSQMVLELVHRLATEDSLVVNKILDNVILLLVPSLNPDGQIIVTDWYNKNVGTEYEASPLPWLYHPYIGHDNNRDMYMFTQKESQMTARLLWHDWFPSVWLDEHQMGSQGARIFVMPATDPINQNVHPLIYRWNGIFGQSQAAALEAAGKEGIIYNSTYTNFWQGAMAWSGWWHNQVGLLTEVASARIASPVEQRKAQPGSQTPAATDDFQSQQRRQMENPSEPLPPPRDITPRTEYPRPWLGGKWTLRDIVDYELIATMALLETAADHREQLLRQIYAVNLATVEAGAKGEPAAIIIPV